MNYQQQNEYLKSLEVYWNYKQSGNLWRNSCINPPGKRRIVNQKEIIEFIRLNPGYTESEIMEELYGFVRGGFESNKKYADCLRRALRSNKIKRKKMGSKKIFHYYVPSNEEIQNNTPKNKDMSTKFTSEKKSTIFVNVEIQKKYQDGPQVNVEYQPIFFHNGKEWSVDDICAMEISLTMFGKTNNLSCDEIENFKTQYGIDLWEDTEQELRNNIKKIGIVNFINQHSNFKIQQEELKVGDYITIIDRKSGHGYDIGDIVRVKLIEKSGCVVRDNWDICYFVDKDEFVRNTL